MTLGAVRLALGVLARQVCTAEAPLAPAEQKPPLRRTVAFRGRLGATCSRTRLPAGDPATCNSRSRQLPASGWTRHAAPRRPPASGGRAASRPRGRRPGHQRGFLFDQNWRIACRTCRIASVAVPSQKPCEHAFALKITRKQVARPLVELAGYPIHLARLGIGGEMMPVPNGRLVVAGSTCDDW